MREFKKRRSKREELMRFCIRALGVVVLMLVTFFSTRAAWAMYGNFEIATQGSKAAEMQLTQLTHRHHQIAQAVEALQHDRGIEAQIRERYGVALPGEGQIQIVRGAASTTQKVGESENVFIRFWQALFGWL